MKCHGVVSLSLSQVAELKNGSVLLTSRNLYNKASGLAGRMFARSDDGGANWAAVWSAVNDPGKKTRLFCDAILCENLSFCQDRLWTNIEKALKKEA